jgi:hypothetical protein
MLRLPQATLLMTLLLSSCSEPLGTEHSYMKERALYNAYVNDSPEHLDGLLERWQQEVPPISDLEFAGLSDKEQAVHEVFEAFYDPLNNIRLDPEFHDHYYDNYYWFIVQNNISYRIVDVPGMANEQSVLDRVYLDNFRPQLHFPDRSIVYLTMSYYTLLNNFLMDQVIPRGVIATVKDRDESEKRLQFLKNSMNILSTGQWLTISWRMVTAPNVHFIDLDADLREAYLEYGINHKGGYARMKKSPEGWVVTESKWSWISKPGVSK